MFVAVESLCTCEGVALPPDTLHRATIDLKRPSAALPTAVIGSISNCQFARPACGFVRLRVVSRDGE